MPVPDTLSRDSSREFTATHWSVVLVAGRKDSLQAAEALEKLCQTYWYPLYAFVRRQGYEVVEAEDVTQEFFARFLAKEYVGRADPTRGRFRNFLLTCLRHFLSEQRRQAARTKRGGGQKLLSWDSCTAEERYRLEPADSATPERIYDRRWALTLIEHSLQRLGEEQSALGKASLFAEIKEYLWSGKREAAYAKRAATLGMTEGALKVAVHRLRRRYRELLREEVAHTVATLTDVDEELRYLVSVIRG